MVDISKVTPTLPQSTLRPSCHCCYPIHTIYNASLSNKTIQPCYNYNESPFDCSIKPKRVETKVYLEYLPTLCHCCYPITTHPDPSLHVCHWCHFIIHCHWCSPTTVHPMTHTYPMLCNHINIITHLMSDFHVCACFT